MLENIPQFNIGDYVIYNPNIPNLEPPHQRPQDIAIIIGIGDEYANIQYILSGYISTINYTRKNPNEYLIDIYTEYSLTKLPANCPIPVRHDI